MSNPHWTVNIHTFFLAETFCLCMFVETIEVGCLHNTASLLAPCSFFISDDFAAVCINELPCRT